VSDRRRQLGGFAVLALVFLRLAVGWHFFSAGLEKIERDSQTGQVRLSPSFEAATTGFLSAAKGPFADFYHSFVPDGHDWQSLLAVPHQNEPLSSEKARVLDAQAPYQNWYARIVADWQEILDKAVAVPRLTEDQIQKAKAAFATRQEELKEYLAGETAAIADYQHELWRLEQWRAKPEADGAPFQEERIAKKAAETASTARAWVAGAAEIEQSYLADLREVLTPEQRANATTAAEMEAATTSRTSANFQRVALGAAVLTIGVGICLLLGLFTRLASLAGALFLASVIATQPPWLPNAEPTIYQTVELAGLLVLAGTGAGRWLGLDYFTWALFHKRDD
jgi:uncharacterized membrane protein YphA (DoxX/SURF4 family)